MKKYTLILIFVVFPVLVNAQYNWQVVLPDLIGNVQYHYSSLTCLGKNCYLVGNTYNRVSSTYQQFFMTSKDGGNTWDSTRFGSSKFLIPFLTKIFALDTMHIYATGDSGYFTKSIDGGKTWSPLRRIWEAHDYNDICFIDSLHGFIVGASGVIVTTSNAGETWNFNRTDHGWYLKSCVGFKGGKYLAFDHWGRLFHSNDFGITWDTIFAYHPILGDNFQFSLKTTYFRDSLDGFIYGTRMPENNGIYFPWIIHTSDGGKNWTTLVDTSTDNVLDLFSMCFLTPDKGLAVGRDTKYLITNDGGNTWTTDSIDLPETDWSFIDNVTKASENVVLATAGNAVSNYLVKGTQKPASVSTTKEPASHLFPNPVKDKLFLDAAMRTKDRIFVYDLTGRRIKEVSGEELTKREVDCSKLPAGVYWLVFSDNNTYKFIKQ